MPFVRKTDSQCSQPPTDAHKLIIGHKQDYYRIVSHSQQPVILDETRCKIA
jgi:hypothetical protein